MIELTEEEKATVDIQVKALVLKDEFLASKPPLYRMVI